MDISDSPFTDKLTILRGMPFCEGLPERDISLLASRGHLVEYKRGEFVFRQREEAEAFYIILSGRLAILRQDTHHSSILAYLYRGDYFGEVALLTNEHHSASARIMNDAVLMIIPRTDFLELMERIPTLALRISQVLSRRLRVDNRLLNQVPHEAQIVTIYSTTAGLGQTTFAITLATSLANEIPGHAILLDMSRGGEEISSRLRTERRIPLMRCDNIQFAVEQQFHRDIINHPAGFDILNVGYTDTSDAIERVMAPLLSALAERYRFILIDLSAATGRMALKTLTQSDIIYLLIGSSEESRLKTADLIGTLRSRYEDIDAHLHLVLNETASRTQEAAGTTTCRIAARLPAIDPLLRSTLQEGNLQALTAGTRSSYMRTVRQLARRLGGVQIGLALGSGAALGLAHIGVLKVLEREATPIDLVAGSSIGAFLAACWVTGKSASELEQMALELTGMRKMIGRLVDLSFPWAGFIRGRKVMRMLNHLLGDRTFDDAHIPLSIVATNLKSRRETVFTTGVLADAVRASISIAGIFEPARIGNTLYLDGGVVDPVPIAPLRQAGATKIIAVSVLASPEEIAQREEQRLEAIHRRRELARRRSAWAFYNFQLRQRMRDALTTNVFDVIMQAMQAMEYEIAESSCRQADLLIRPTAPSAGWVEFYHAKRFIEHGEREAERMIPQIKQLVASG